MTIQPGLAVLAFAVSSLSPSPEQEAPRLPDGEIVVTVLFDNLYHDPAFTPEGLETGWGFAALLETPDHTILFDAGADGDILLENMRILGKNPSAIEAVVISHAHGDHTGGLQALFDLGLRPTLYLLSAFPGEFRHWAASATEVVEVEAGARIIPGIRSTGQVGTAIPEQALVLETAGGPVVLTGCAHPGAVQMARRAQEISPGQLHAVLGGFHLLEAEAFEIRAIIEAFRRMGVTRAGPTHCSGELAMTLFEGAYGSEFIHLGVGRILRFPT